MKSAILFGLLLIGFVIAPRATAHAIGRLAGPTAVAMFLALGSIGTARLALTGLGRLFGNDRMEDDRAFLLVTGYPLFGGILFIAGLGSTRPLMIVTIAVVMSVVGARTFLRKRSAGQEETGIGWVPLLLLGAAGLLAALMASLPAVSLDEVAYHLAIPEIWVETGRTVALPLMSHSWFPLGTESVDMVALTLLGHSGAIASHLLHLLVAGAGLLLMLRWLEERGSPVRGIGVAAIVSTPAIVVAAGWSGTDVPLMASTVALFVATDRFLRKEGGVGPISIALASGLLIKYTFVAIASIVIGIAIVHSSRRSLLVRGALIGLVAGSIFFVRNLVLTGNPVEPFLTGETGVIERYRWEGSFGSSLLSYLSFTRFVDDSLGWLLPLLALAGLFMWRRIDERWLHSAVAAFLVATGGLLFLAPAGRILLPFLLIPAMIALAVMEIRREKARRAVALLLISLAIVQLGVSGLFIHRLDPLGVPFGKVDEEEWIAERRSPQELIDEGNMILPEEGRTLVLGLNELFWFEGDVRGGGNFDSGRFDALFSGEGFREWLQDQEITHMLVYPGGIIIDHESEDAEISQRILVLTSQAAENLRSFLQEETTLLSGTENAGLHRIDAAP